MKTHVRTHLRRKKHGKSLVRHHKRRIHGRRGMAMIGGEREAKFLNERMKEINKQVLEGTLPKEFEAGWKNAMIDADLIDDIEKGEPLTKKERKELVVEKVKATVPELELMKKQIEGMKEGKEKDAAEKALAKLGQSIFINIKKNRPEEKTA